MTTKETQTLLNSLASLGAAIASAAAPASAATFALSAIARELPHLVAVASILLANGKPSDEMLKAAHDESVALLDPSSIRPTEVMG